MAKNRNNKRVSSKKVAQDKERNERRKQAIAKRVAGQFKDLPAGKRQRIEKALRRHV